MDEHILLSNQSTCGSRQSSMCGSTFWMMSPSKRSASIVLFNCSVELIGRLEIDANLPE